MAKLPNIYKVLSKNSQKMYDQYALLMPTGVLIATDGYILVSLDMLSVFEHNDSIFPDNNVLIHYETISKMSKQNVKNIRFSHDGVFILYKDGNEKFYEYDGYLIEAETSKYLLKNIGELQYPNIQYFFNNLKFGNTGYELIQLYTKYLKMALEILSAASINNEKLVIELPNKKDNDKKFPTLPIKLYINDEYTSKHNFVLIMPTNYNK